jgi:hypothetical protein
VSEDDSTSTSYYGSLPSVKIVTYAAANKVARVYVYGDPTSVPLYLGYDSSPIYLYVERLPATDVAVTITLGNIGTNAASTVTIPDKVEFGPEEDYESFSIFVADTWDNTLSETLELIFAIDTDSTDKASFSVLTATLTFTVSSDVTNVPVDFTLDCTTYSAGSNRISGVTFTTTSSGTVYGVLVHEKGPVFADVAEL